MKRVTTSFGRCARLGSIALVLLLSQQAFAAGTDAGVSVANQAQVDYDVGGNAQELILSDPNGNSTPGLASGALATTFLVDNRVDFTLVEFGLPGATPVNPGQSGAVTTFELTNTGNSTQDYNLAVVNLGSGAVNGNTDTAEMSNLRVFADTDSSGDWDPSDAIFVDELAADTSILIFVVADASTALINGDVGNIEVTATTHDAGVGGLGALTTDDAGIADGTGTVEVVFADDGIGGIGNGFQLAQDGYLVSSAALVITKEVELISDPFNGTTNQKAIPGAIIEYVITVANTGGEAATNVVISDVLTDITLLSDFFGGAEVQIDNDSAVFTCTEESGDDVCTLAAGTLTVGVPGPAVGLDVAAGTSMTITFRVTIN